MSEAEDPHVIPSEFTQYRSIIAAGFFDLRYCDMRDMWVLQTGGTTCEMLHPLLPLSHITILLRAYADIGEEELELVARMTLSSDEGGIEMKLIGGMGIVPAVETGISEFVLYATNRFGNSSTRSVDRKRYDCIQTLTGDDDDIQCGVYEEEINKPFSQVKYTLCSVMFIHY